MEGEGPRGREQILGTDQYSSPTDLTGGQELLKASADAETHHDSAAVSVKKNRGKRRKCLKTLQTGVCTPLVHGDPSMYNVSSTVTF